MHVIGTAGHVDHGKSALVRALSGIDPDRLREEKERGLTIDLGFAWLTLPTGREVSIVDVPGHERFIRNMLAGVGGIDMALLVVAADEGVMPQTREHLAIIDLLRIERGLVVITKSDLVDEEWLELVASDIEEVLEGSSLQGSRMVNVSSVTGEGLPELLSAMDGMLQNVEPRPDDGHPRLPIDRAFTISGFGTVVTGTLVGGQLAVGDEVELVPGGQRGRVRGIQTHKHSAKTGTPGSRVAANLSGIGHESNLPGPGPYPPRLAQGEPRPGYQAAGGAGLSRTGSASGLGHAIPWRQRDPGPRPAPGPAGACPRRVGLGAIALAVPHRRGEGRPVRRQVTLRHPGGRGGGRDLGAAAQAVQPHGGGAPKRPLRGPTRGGAAQGPGIAGARALEKGSRRERRPPRRSRSRPPNPPHPRRRDALGQRRGQRRDGSLLGAGLGVGGKQVQARGAGIPREAPVKEPGSPRRS